jgi:hypothetical protein
MLRNLNKLTMSAGLTAMPPLWLAVPLPLTTRAGQMNTSAQIVPIPRSPVVPTTVTTWITCAKKMRSSAATLPQCHRFDL